MIGRAGSRLNMFWRVYATFSGIFFVVWIMSTVLLHVASSEQNQPVVRVTDVRVHTPVVHPDGDVEFSVWRESLESCPGTVTFAWQRVEESSRASVISTTFPFSTPGFKSPPRLVIRRPVPDGVGPGRWRVRTGVDSRCPTRRRFDDLANFVVTVVPSGMPLDSGEKADAQPDKRAD